jgi:hypothetical protein
VWISGVDIPEELVRAARSGSLVLFVGAGASRDAPASLPSFTGLTSQIADEAGVPQVDAESSDVFLGRLDDSGVDVHERVRAHLDPPGSRPNAQHKSWHWRLRFHASSRPTTTPTSRAWSRRGG